MLKNKPAIIVVVTMMKNISIPKNHPEITIVAEKGREAAVTATIMIDVS